MCRMTGKDIHEALFPKGKDVCPQNCPDRCAEPNCHNVKTCERWAAHVAARDASYKQRREIAEKRRRPYD